MRKKNKTEKFVDDGRTVANMNVEGMPWFVNEDDMSKRGNPDSDEPIKLTKSESRSLMWGVVLAALLVGLVFAVGFLVFILFCVFVWFK